jgi:feruloyl esterase
VDDRVRTDVWLPATGWNGRFQGTGGGGFAAGSFDYALAPAVKDGYAAASTDAGVSVDSLSAATWALDEHGNVNQGLLTNFASRSVHEMSLIGEQVTASFYGRRASHSYWNGCSTGGRQGMMEAQRYPRDFDGIVASAPATDMDRLAFAHLWPFVVMNQEHTFPTGCELEAFNRAAIAACDHDDGVADGIISRPEQCEYDPSQLVGQTVPCENGPVQITEADARVVRMIWDGPRSPDGKRLWYGLPRGTPFDPLATTVASPEGTRHGVLFPIADDWIRYFVKRQPSFDPSTIGYRDFERLFEQSHDEYGDVVGTGDPDLSGFRDAGGRMITWHGLADRLIPFQDTVDYRRRVEDRMGGTRATDRFWRVFLAPGADHCGSGAGPAPTDPLAAVVDWVEKGHAPDALPAAMTTAEGRTITRNLCRYPLVSRYTGHGDPAAAASFRCVTPR